MKNREAHMTFKIWIKNFTITTSISIGINNALVFVYIINWKAWPSSHVTNMSLTDCSSIVELLTQTKNNSDNMNNHYNKLE